MITGDFVNGIHLMVGLSTDTKPDTTSENTFFLEEDTGDVYYYSDGEWAQAGDDVAMIIASILGGGSELPVVDASDNGKVLGVSNGAWAVVSGGGGGDVTPAAVADAIGNMTSEQIGGVVSDLDVVPSPVIVTVSGSAAYTCNAGDNRIYKCEEIPALTIVDSAQNISFTVDFTSGSTATVLTVPSGYKAPGGDLTPEAGKAYELNVRNGKAVLTAFEAVSTS